jgi:hypothetical protein
MKMHRTAYALALVAAIACGEAESPDPHDEKAQTDAGASNDVGPNTGDSSVDSHDAATTETDGGTDPAPTFARIYDEILVPSNCTNGYCHGSGAGYLTLSDLDTSYASLVGARAFNGSCEVELRVAPSDPEASLLWRKIAPGISVCAEKMPFGTDGLPTPQAELLRRWIEAGAPR